MNKTYMCVILTSPSFIPNQERDINAMFAKFAQCAMEGELQSG